MNIQPHDRTLHMLLNNPIEQLVVPSYQRRYSWEDKQTGFLFEDIDMLQPNEGHLFGMLIIHTGFHSGGLNKVDVVDGQQRLTTIVILLSVLKRFFADTEQLHLVSEISSMLRSSDGKNIDLPKLVLGELDNRDLQTILSGKTDNIFNQNILRASQLFEHLINIRIEQEGEEWLSIFYRKLVHTAKIIRVDVQQAQDAYKLFETINNRGLPLSATDILKNFILGHAAKISSNKLLEVKDLWSKVIISLDGISTDDFFRQYVTSVYARKITKSNLIDAFKKDYFKEVKDVHLLGEYLYTEEGSESSAINEDEKDEEQIKDDIKVHFDIKENKLTSVDENRIDITLYLEKIVSCASTYSKIFNKSFESKKINLKLIDLASIRCFPSYIFLMHFMQLEMTEKEMLKVLDMVAAIMIRRHVCERRTSENDDIFAKLLKLDITDSYLDKIKDSLIEDYPDDDEFSDRFPTQQLKGILEVRAKYILTQLEYNMTGNTNEFTLNSGTDVHLEHIIPQNITSKSSKNKYGDWESYLGDKAVMRHKKYINRIGNMTLLASELNIKASNNPFSRKKQFYKDSNIAITKHLGTLGNFKFTTVDNRGVDLAKKALKIWKI